MRLSLFILLAVCILTVEACSSGGGGKGGSSSSGGGGGGKKEKEKDPMEVEIPKRKREAVNDDFPSISTKGENEITENAIRQIDDPTAEQEGFFNN